MKRLILFLSLFTPAVALAATETQILTYPTDIEFVYDSDRDTSSGKNRVVVVDGDQGNGMAAGGDTGVLIVRGSIYKSGLVGSPYFSESFAEGAAGKGLRNIQADGTAFDTAQLILNYSLLGGGGIVGVTNSGGSANTTGPVMTSVGLDIAGEQTAADGWELTLGWLGASGKAFVVGTDPAFYNCATFKVADASGINPLVVGFRSPDATTATIANFTEYIYYGIVGTSDPNTLQTVTEVDANLDGTGDGVTTTDTTETFADGATKTLCVFVSGAGVGSYTKDGAAPTTTVAVTMTDGMMLIPFIRATQAADLSGTLEILDWEVGYTALKPLGD